MVTQLQGENKKITAIIVDDESPARQALLHALKSFTCIDVIAQCEHGLAAVKAVHELEPQVMFLDIHMPKLDGFDVLDLLGEEAPVTIFVTAYDEHAIAAFESNALDYLLKPVSEARLQKTIERLQQQMQAQEGGVPSRVDSAFIEEQKQVQAPIQRVLVRDKSDVHVIPAVDIQYIESADDYVVIHTEAGNHIKQERLQNLENTLDSQLFCRIHRSSIINLTFLSGIETESRDNKVAVMKNKERLAVSRAGYHKLLKLL